jgi:hypothetical protein
MNPDEEQWIICANSFVDSPSNWFKYFFVADYSRFFTFFPLSIFSFIFDGATYFHARIVQQVFFLIFLFYQWKLLKEAFNTKVAYYTSALLFIIFSTSSHYDLINYNSEMASLALISFIIYFYFVKTLKSNRITNVIILGVSISLLPFTKEQTILIAAAIGCFVTYDFLRSAKYKFALIFILSGIVFPAIVIGGYSYVNGISTLMANLQIGVDYSEAASVVSRHNVSFLSRFYSAFISRILQNNDFGMPLFFVFLTIIIYLFKLVKRKEIVTNIEMFQFIMFATILYTVFGIKTPIYHYYIFIFIPISWYLSKFFIIGVEVFKLNKQLFFFTIGATNNVLQSNPGFNIKALFLIIDSL